LLLPAACSPVDDAPVSATNAAFLHGVASGDPDSTSVVIWTRISNATGTTAVDWRVASDVEFQNVVANGKYSTDEIRDHTVKVVVNELSPGQDYFYQFVVDGRPSPTGRTKTLPIGHVDRMVFAVATISTPMKRSRKTKISISLCISVITSMNMAATPMPGKPADVSGVIMSHRTKH
jgi:alkaline phosphatase D